MTTPLAMGSGEQLRRAYLCALRSERKRAKQRAKIQAARDHLVRTRHSYRSAAAVLGVNHVHLAFVLSGSRVSEALVARVLKLNLRKDVPAQSIHLKRSLQGRSI